MSDLGAVFSDLRQLLAPFAARLVAARDEEGQLYVDTRQLQSNGKPLFFGAVQIKKSTVSYHLMPVYLKPELLDAISPALKARMHGKSCFSFSRVEPALFSELAALTVAGYASYRALGFVP